MTIETDFRFNRSGQGCFYTGFISAYGKELTFAYDCGTDSIRNNLKNDITHFKKRLHGNNLDLLIISHFDADHVNEVKNLLTRTVCNTIIIPYLLPEERKFLLAMYYYHLDRDNSEFATDENYELFINDPINFFTSKDFDINRIVIIKRRIGKEGIQDKPIENDTPPESDRGNDVPVMINLSNSPELQRLVFKHDADGIKNAKTKGIMMNFCTHTGNIRLGGIWYFKFFNLSQSVAKIKRFNTALRKRLGLSHGGLITTADIRKIFMNGFTNQIKTSYKNIFGDVNSTSIVVFHGPVFQKFALDIHNHYGEEYFPPFFWRRLHWHLRFNNSCGTLLTGDVDLSGNNLNEITEYFQQEFNKIRFFQVPHHGSVKSWNRQILDLLNYAEFIIVNSGLGNRHKHPSGLVIQDIYDFHDRKIILNNQINSFSYELVLQYP